MSEKLPILISIPHGGEIIPKEVKDIVNITPRDIFNDGDPLTRLIYDLKEHFSAQVEMDIARAVIDVNRAPDDRPPKNPDGVVKTETTDRTPVYIVGKYPSNELIEQLLQKYYYPFHEKIDKLIIEGNIKLCLDCHSMLAEAPVISKNPGVPRPLICLSNGGDENAEQQPGERTITCPPEQIRMLAEFFRMEFGNEGDVRINRPFLGGYNSRLHFKNNKVPWIQVELNRSLYLSEPYFNEQELTVSKERTDELNNRIWWVFKKFAEHQKI